MYSCIFTYVCIYILHVYIYIHIYIYTYIYIYTLTYITTLFSLSLVLSSTHSTDTHTMTSESNPADTSAVEIMLEQVRGMVKVQSVRLLSQTSSQGHDPFTVCQVVCCSVLQCVAVCWSALQCVADLIAGSRPLYCVPGSVLQCVAVCAVCCSVLQCVSVRCRLDRRVTTLFTVCQVI